MPTDVIAEHAFFGPVTSEGWNLVFHPPTGRPGIAYKARFSHEPTRPDYEALTARLPAFEAFCRHIDANERLARGHFRSWPASAGPFELVGAEMSGTAFPLPWALEPGPYGPDAPQYRPFALQYRALDQDVWDFSGIPWHPPVFAALFDEAGRFSGVDHEVEHGMRGLPETIVASRWASGYRHPYFGRCDLSELSRIGTATLARRKIPLDLFMTSWRMAAFEPEHLDPFVPLAERLAELDARVRADFPEQERLDWLAHRFACDDRALRRALGKAFPGADAPHEVSAPLFAAALILDRACFALPPEGSGGAALTLDYRILPRRMDQYLFAAKFSLDGDLLDVVVES